jgi:hypothetical protein
MKRLPSRSTKYHLVPVSSCFYMPSQAYLRWNSAEDIEDGIDSGHENGLLANPASLLEYSGLIVAVR